MSSSIARSLMLTTPSDGAWPVPDACVRQLPVPVCLAQERGFASDGVSNSEFVGVAFAIHLGHSSVQRFESEVEEDATVTFLAVRSPRAGEAPPTD